MLDPTRWCCCRWISANATDQYAARSPAINRNGAQHNQCGEPAQVVLYGRDLAISCEIVSNGQRCQRTYVSCFTVGTYAPSLSLRAPVGAGRVSIQPIVAHCRRTVSRSARTGATSGSVRMLMCSPDRYHFVTRQPERSFQYLSIQRKADRRYTTDRNKRALLCTVSAGAQIKNPLSRERSGSSMSRGSGEISRDTPPAVQSDCAS